MNDNLKKMKEKSDAIIKAEMEKLDDNDLKKLKERLFIVIEEAMKKHEEYMILLSEQQLILIKLQTNGVCPYLDVEKCPFREPKVK